MTPKPDGPTYRVITLFPEMFAALNYGVVGRSLREKRCALSFYNPRDYSQEPRQRVDDRSFGGGAGMVLMPAPLARSIQAALDDSPQETPVIYLTPQGKPLTQARCYSWSHSSSLILLSGRYEGIDERIVEKYVTEEISLGDYILTGGDLAAMILLDAVIRLLPGCLGDASSSDQDSFSKGLLDWPHYTRPACFEGIDTPAILLSGNHQFISRWRLKQALGRTWLRRPELIVARGLSVQEKLLLDEFLLELGLHPASL